MKLGNTNYTLYNKKFKSQSYNPSFICARIYKKLCIYKNILWFDQINLEEG